MIQTLSLLLVEDNPADVDLIRELLSESGPIHFELEVVDRLAEAIGRAQRGDIDLALLDLGLPDSNGLNTFLSFHRAAPGVATVVLTGNDDQDVAIAAVTAGAQDFLVKGQVRGNMLVRAARYAVERQRADERERLARDVLECLNHPESTVDTIQEILRIVRRGTGCEAVGVRLREGDDFPYFETNGFPDGFLEAERHLCTRDGAGQTVCDAQGSPVLACMCGTVLCGRTDPALPCFTWGGSFWTGSTTDLLASTTQKDRQALTRDRCTGEGYESVALIPLRAHNEIIGLLQLNDHRRDQFTPQSVRFLEGLGASIGIALERRQTEANLRESERRYRAVAHAAADAIIIADVAGTIVGWNPAAERMFGYTEREACGQPLTLMIPQRYRDRHLQSVERLGGGTGERHIIGTSVEMAGLRKDGSEVPVELSLATWDSGAERFYSGIIRDITERKRAEEAREKLEAQLRQAQKMEAVGRLAGGVAHDFNNMLAVICGYADLALISLDPSDPTYPDIQEVAKAGRRSADLVRQLLAFSRQQTIVPRSLDLNEAIASLLKMLHRLIGEDIDLRWKPGGDQSTVVMDPAQVDQILANLMVNARDAIEGVGVVTIETGAAEFDEDFCATHPGLVPGKYVLLAVSDDGCGMNGETLAQIFEPFFTTKSQREGTGLGLSTVYGIVKQNEGFIDVVSEPGRGTTFRIYLPMHDRLDAAADQAQLPGDGSTGTETLLLVEDDETLLRLGLRTLEQLGYTVLSTQSPNQAIEMAQDYRGVIDLLVTDVVMPEMDGRRLQQRLTHARPGLKCLFTSGYTADVLAHRGVLDDGVSFLAKPYSAKALADKIRQVISAP